jgi:hypothetical protein
MIEYNRNMVRVLVTVLLIGFGASTGKALDLPGETTVNADFIDEPLPQWICDVGTVSSGTVITPFLKVTNWGDVPVQVFTDPLTGVQCVVAAQPGKNRGRIEPNETATIELPGLDTRGFDGRLLKHVRFRFSSPKPCPLEVSLNCALNSGTL